MGSGERVNTNNLRTTDRGDFAKGVPFRFRVRRCGKDVTEKANGEVRRSGPSNNFFVCFRIAASLALFCSFLSENSVTDNTSADIFLAVFPLLLRPCEGGET